MKFRSWLPFYSTFLIYFCTAICSRAATTRFVVKDNIGAAPPYTTWPTAANNIQFAIDVSSNGDTIIVSNGVYDVGGRKAGTYILTNRVTIDKAITVQSVNGYAVTQITGHQVPGTTNGPSAVRCAYVTNGATLVGFTLTGGATLDVTTNADGYGGGVKCDGGGGVVSRCWMSGNSSRERGGGSEGGTLYNCLVSLNTSSNGGGCNQSSLFSCTVISNRASGSGGGVFVALTPSLIRNILYFNDAPDHPNLRVQSGGGTYANNCSTPSAPAFGVTNISDPRIVSTTFPLLQSDSSCINVEGSEIWTTNDMDLGGHTRKVGVASDLGAFEYQGTDDTDGDGIPDLWEGIHGLSPLAPNAQGANSDSDWMTDLEEYFADTEPTNGQSFFPNIVISNSVAGTMDLVVDPTSTARVYQVFSEADLLDSPQIWAPYGGTATGAGTGMTFTVTNDAPSRFYRTGVRLP